MIYNNKILLKKEKEVTIAVLSNNIISMINKTNINNKKMVEIFIKDHKS